MRKLLAITLVLAALMAVSCSKGESKHSLSGTVRTKVDLVEAADYVTTAEIDTMFTNGTPCITESTNGLSGAQVVVKGADGSVIATTDLDKGKVSDKGAYCTLKFEADVPSSDFYSFEIDGDDDPVTYSKTELEDADWSVELTSGS